MSTSLHVKLHNIPESLNPLDAIECTVNGEPHDAKFLRYGELMGELWNRVIWVQIENLRELPNGKLVVWNQLSMFDDVMAFSFRDEFVINRAPGCEWDGTAGTQYEGG